MRCGGLGNRTGDLQVASQMANHYTIPLPSRSDRILVTNKGTIFGNQKAAKCVIFLYWWSWESNWRPIGRQPNGQLLHHTTPLTLGKGSW